MNQIEDTFDETASEASTCCPDEQNTYTECELLLQEATRLNQSYDLFIDLVLLVVQQIEKDSKVFSATQA